MSPEHVTLALAAVALLVMGFATQRGGTCLAAAVGDAVQGRFSRAVSLLEAVIWAAAILHLAQAAGLGMPQPAARPVTGQVLLGGVLLGFGAWANGGCILGTLARFGNGELRMVATFAGLVAGAFVLPVLPRAPEPQSAAALPMTMVAGLAAGGLLAALAVRVWLALGSAPPGRPIERLRALENPWPATIVLGITFAIAWMLLGSRWTFVEILNQIPGGAIMGAGWRAVLLAAVLGGALIGGMTARRFALTWPSLGSAGASFVGGTSLAVGAGLVPNHNDALIFLGLPFLLPHALAGLAAMVLTVALLVVARERLGRRASAQGAG